MIYTDIEKEPLPETHSRLVLDTEDFSLSYHFLRWTDIKSNGHLKFTLTALLFSTIGLLTVIALVSHNPPKTFASAAVKTEASPCGTTPEYAAKAGCIFDLMNYGWTPPACYDHELSNSSISRGPWKWFYDHNGTESISEEVISRGQVVHVWTEHHFHLTHCLYAFKTIHKASLTGQLVPKEFFGWNHTLHCENMLSKTGKDPKKISTKVTMLFNPCVKLEDGETG